MNFSIILFLSGIIVSLIILNWTLYFPISKAFSLQRKSRLLLLLILLILNMLFLWGEVFRRFWDINWLSTIGNIWLGVLAISFSIMVFNLLIFVLIRKMFRYTTIASLTFIVVLSFVALFNNLTLPEVLEYDIYSNKISPEAERIKIVLISEFHLLSNTNRTRIEKVINRINQLQPDLIIIAGDLIDDKYQKINHFIPKFQALQSRYGTFSVPGNHDYYSNINSYLKFTAEAGIYNLLNENRVITEDLVLVGVTDRTSTLNPPDVEQAMQGIEREPYIVFVSHQPLYHKEAIDQGADLILAGHTHRGQIPPLRFLVGLRFPYSYGYYEERGRIIYTTSGVNTWGPPMRLFSRNEIVVFNLYPQKSEVVEITE